jgi:hypothetical protein
MIFRIALFTFLCSFVQSKDKFDYKLTSECSEWKTNSSCAKWTHTGKIEEDLGSSSCFHEDTFVMTPYETTQMKFLQQGDKILGLNDKHEPEYTTVRLWLHRETNSVESYKTIVTSNGSLTSSLTHNIAVRDIFTNEISYKHMDDIHRFDTIVGLDDKINLDHTVKNEYYIEKIGMYAPFTELSNYFVSDDGEMFYLAHSFAYIKNPATYEKTVHNIFDIFEFVDPSINKFDVNSNGNVYINPIAKYMHDSVATIFEIPRYIKNTFFDPRRYLRTSGGSSSSGRSSRSSSSSSSSSSQQQSDEDDEVTVVIPMTVGFNTLEFVIVNSIHLFSPPETYSYDNVTLSNNTV